MSTNVSKAAAAASGDKGSSGCKATSTTPASTSGKSSDKLAEELINSAVADILGSKK